MIWEKKLSTSDAQQPTGGALMPFRFTEGNYTGSNYNNWLRTQFFGALPWTVSGDQEVASATFDVTIGGQSFLPQKMGLNYKSQRPQNNAAPCMHLDFTPTIRSFLQKNNMTGHTIRFEDVPSGNFKMTIF